MDEKDDVVNDHRILDTIYYGKDGRVIVVYWVVEKNTHLAVEMICNEQETVGR